MPLEGFDLLVVGGGKAGKSLTMDRPTAARVERSMIGGTCINVACIPAKTLINSAPAGQDAAGAGGGPRGQERADAGFQHPAGPYLDEPDGVWKAVVDRGIHPGPDAVVTRPTMGEGPNLLFTPAWLED